MLSLGTSDCYLSSKTMPRIPPRSSHKLAWANTLNRQAWTHLAGQLSPCSSSSWIHASAYQLILRFLTQLSFYQSPSHRPTGMFHASECPLWSVLRDGKWLKCTQMLSWIVFHLSSAGRFSRRSTELGIFHVRDLVLCSIHWLRRRRLVNWSLCWNGWELIGWGFCGVGLSRTCKRCRRPKAPR